MYFEVPILLLHYTCFFTPVIIHSNLCNYVCNHYIYMTRHIIHFFVRLLWKLFWDLFINRQLDSQCEKVQTVNPDLPLSKSSFQVSNSFVTGSINFWLKTKDVSEPRTLMPYQTKISVLGRIVKDIIDFLVYTLPIPCRINFTTSFTVFI